VLGGAAKKKGAGPPAAPGRSSSSPSSEPMRYSPPGIRTKRGNRSSRIQWAARKYTAPHEAGTVCDGANAIHLREPGGIQSFGKRRAAADVARADRRQQRARRPAGQTTLLL